jgi:iron complex outermembrane receptor protein
VRRRRFVPCLIGAAAALGAGRAYAQDAPALPARPAGQNDLSSLSIEDLAQLNVRSASKRDEPLSGVPTTLFVITGDDIVNSSASSLPEVLRLAPNLQVQQLDARSYAISARGFNNGLANKLLVMIDGRTVYTPLFAGVFWDVQDTMMEDIDRIEIVSGPGATLWGANAVNGVINVVTKSSRDTQGVLVSGGG